MFGNRIGCDYLIATLKTQPHEGVVYKSNELKSETTKTDEVLAKLGDVDPARGELAVTLFDWTQKAAEIWRGSNNAVRWEILNCVSLNRTLTCIAHHGRTRRASCG